MSPTTFGPFLRRKRVESGVSLRGLAKTLGISAVYLGEVERGRSKPLSRERWPALVEALPNVSYEELEKHAASEAKLQLDLSDAPPAYQNLSYALARRIDERDLSEEDMGKLFDVLGRWKGE